MKAIEDTVAQEHSISLVPLIAEAERVLRAAVVHFGLTVPPERIVVTIQSAGRMKALGWFANDLWQNGKPDRLHEINLCAEHLKSCDIGELILHELAHAENKDLGVQDCAGQRHNRKFKAMAERLGLVVDEPVSNSVGYGTTHLGKPAKAFLKSCAFQRDLFALARFETPEKKEGPGSRLVKVECLDCGYTVRTTRRWLLTGAPLCQCGTTMESDGAAGEAAAAVSAAAAEEESGPPLKPVSELLDERAGAIMETRKAGEALSAAHEVLKLAINEADYALQKVTESGAIEQEIYDRLRARIETVRRLSNSMECFSARCAINEAMQKAWEALP